MISRFLQSSTRFVVTLILTWVVLYTHAQTAADQASNYGGTWSNGSNQGTGFGAWTLTAGTGAGTFLGNPSADGMNNSIIGSTAFGMYSTSTGYANASRNITTAMAVGDAISFHWAVNWDANTGGKGFDFKSGGSTIFNVNIAGSSTITAGGLNAQTAYGTNAMIVTFARVSATQYTFTLTSRDGVSTLFSNTYSIASAIDNINFYIGNQNDGSGNRNMYFNNFKIFKVSHRSNVATGNWNANASWEQSHDNGVSWINATVTPSSALGTVQIRNGHNISVTANVSADQITVDLGGTLTVTGTSVLTVANGTEAIDCLVNGVMVNAGSANPSVNTTAGNLTFGTTGEYRHTVSSTGGTIPLSTWQAGSTCKIMGITTATTIGNIGQSFHHFIWDCPNQTASVNFAGLLTTVNGDMYITDTGSSKIALTGTAGASLTIKGNLVFNNNVVGHFSTLDLATGNSGSSVIILGGNFEMSSGNLTAANTAGGPRQIYFDAITGVVQTINKPAGIISGNIDWIINTQNGSMVRLLTNLSFNGAGSFTVESGAIMDFQTFALTGTVNAAAVFLASNGSHLISANTATLGCFQTSGTTGSIQVAYASRTFTSPSYTFNGTNQQWTGNALTSSIANLTINNTGTTSSVVNVTNAFTIANVLTLTSGILNIGNNNVTLTNSAANSLVGGSSTAYVRTGNATTTLGRFGRAIATTGLPITYLLPVGNSTSYMPATFTFTTNSTARNLTIFAMDGTHSSLSAATNYLANRYWITSLSATAGTYNYTSSFGFLSTDVVGGFGTLKLYRASNSYTDAGSSATATSVTSGPLDQTTGALSANVSWTALGSGAGLSNQTITFNALTAVTYGSSSTLTLNATASSGLPVSYTVLSGPGSVSGSTLTITGAGSIVIQANQAGDASYNPATPVSQTLVVNPKNLTVSGATAQNKVYDGTTTATITGATLVGIVGSDAVTVSGGGSFSQATVANGIGVTAALTLAGAQSGNYTLTQPSGLSANITQASQTITFGALSSVQVGGANFNLTATASSGLTVSYTSSNTAVATVSGNVVTIVGIGSTTITASQAGNTNYSAAADVTQNLVVTAGSLVTWDMSTQTGGTNNFGASPLNGVLSTNVASAQLIRGSGVSTTGTGAAGGWGGINWSQSVTAPTGSTAYIDVTVRVSPGYSMSLSQINSFGYRRSGTGPSSGVLSYSLDGSSFTNVSNLSFPTSTSAGGTHAAVDLSTITALQSLNNCTTVTFRITPFGATASGGTFYIYNVNASTAPDFSIAGSVSALALDPSVSITSNDADNVFCTGSSVTFTASASASTPIAYQWKSDGVNIPGATASTYNSSSLSSSTITVSIDACGETAVSNGIGNTVLTTPTMSVSASSGANVCAGTTPTFTASGATSYDFFINGVSQGTASANNAFIPSTALAAGDVVCVRGYDPLPFTIDGNLSDTYWGSPLATSNGGPVSSGFGANRIDALYLKNGFGYLFGGIAGSLVSNSGNKVLLFIDSKPGGYNNLGSWVARSNAPYKSIENLNGGIQFDAGFEPDLILGINIAGGVVFYDLYDMATNSNLFLDDSNNALYAYQSNTSTGDFSKGFEFSIPINYLGNYGTSIKTLAMVVNDPGFSAATFLSNQFLSAAGSGDGNYGDGAVNFGLATPNPVTYSVIQDCYAEQCFTASPSVTPSVSIVSDDTDNSICAGTSVTFTATATNGGTTPAYQWKLNGSNVGTDATTYTNTALSNGDVVTVVLTANNACQSSSTANGNSITTSVTSNVTPSVSIVSDDTDNNICAGTSVTFTATATNGGTTPAYQWKLNGSNVGTDATTYTNTALSNGDVVTVVLTANNACQSSSTANGNNITTTVNSSVIPSVSIVSDDTDNSICAGTSVTFTATATNGGTTPAYQWKLNGSNVGTDATTYTTAALSNGDVVTVVLTANNACQSSSTANGNSITTTVNSNVTPSVSIASDDADNSICAGTSVTFTATATNGGTTPAYQWKLNGSNVGTDATTYTTAALSNGDVVTVVLTANNACQSSSTANGNSITTTVTSNVTPSVSIVSDDADNSICAGTSVTFTATATNGGTTPAYQWKLNGSNVGTDATTYTNTALSNGDVVTVVLTANNACQSSSTANGNNITTTVNSSVIPSVSIVSDDTDNSICAGTSVTFTATATNGGTTPAYQWKLNGSNVGTDATTCTTAALSNGDVVTVVLTANNACQSSSTANGNSITTTVNSSVTPSVSIVSDDADNSICAGTSVTFTATATNGGTTPAYQWKLNGSNVGTDATTYTNTALSNGDVVTVVLTANNACQSSSTANGNSITTAVGVVTTYYLDLDQDGYGANGTAVSDCVQPNGYSAQNGDCNPNDDMVYPGAVEFCNQTDDDCDGIVDEDLTFQDFYLDNDGDGYGSSASAFSACDLPAGYIVAGGDCNDANTNVYPGAQELCSTAIDDDCDGLINEICAPGNDNPAFASNCPLSTLSTCTTVTGTLQGASPSGSFGTNVLSNNNDVWYYFTANGPGMTIRCTPNGNDVGLELRSSSGVLLKFMNATSNPTDEYMNYDDLTFGNQYYLRVMNMNSAQSGNGFSLCAKRISPANSAFNYTNVFIYNTGCTDVVPTNLSTFTSTTILLTPVGGGLTYSAPGPLAQLGSFLSNDGYGVNYNTVYTGQVIKNIAYPLGDGSTELLSFNTNVTNTLNVLPCVDIDLGANYICPRLWGVGAMMRADRWICGAVKYQWRFEQYLNGQPYLINGNPVVIEQYGANGSRDIYTLASYGFLPGSEWRVKIRPVFPNNVHGDYGTDEQCMKFKGSFAASPIWEEVEGEWNTAEKFVLYPNPSLNGQLSIVGMTEDASIQQIIVRDASGRLVKEWESTGEEQTMVSMNLTELKTGMYWVTIMGSGTEFHQRWIKE